MMLPAWLAMRVGSNPTNSWRKDLSDGCRKRHAQTLGPRSRDQAPYISNTSSCAYVLLKADKMQELKMEAGSTQTKTGSS